MNAPSLYHPRLRSLYEVNLERTRERTNIYDALRVLTRCGLVIIREAIDTRTKADKYALARLDAARLRLRRQLDY